MATEYVYFQGEAIWCRVHEKQKDEKYDRYSIGIFLDEASEQRRAECGVQITPKTDKESGEQFYQFARPDKKLINGELVNFGVPHIFLKGGDDEERFTGDVGNGSKVTAKVAVYDTKKGKGHRLESIRVDELVEYVREEKDPGVDAPW